MWDLPRPGLEPVSPVLAGRFLTTAPPAMSLESAFKWGGPGKHLRCTQISGRVFQEKRDSTCKGPALGNEPGVFVEKKTCVAGAIMQMSCLWAGSGKRGTRSQDGERALVWIAFRYAFVYSTCRWWVPIWCRNCARQNPADKDESLEKLTVGKTEKSTIPHLMMWQELYAVYQ